MTIPTGLIIPASFVHDIHEAITKAEVNRSADVIIYAGHINPMNKLPIIEVWSNDKLLLVVNDCI